MLFAVMSLPTKKENHSGLPGQDTMLSSVLAVASNFQQERVHTEQSSFKVDRVDSRRPDLPGKSVAVPISMRRRETKRTRVNERRTGGMLHGAVEVAFKELRDAYGNNDPSIRRSLSQCNIFKQHAVSRSCRSHR